MKNLTLSFSSRLRLNLLIDAIPGPLGRIRPMLEVMKHTAFTEEEIAQVKQSPGDAPGTTRYEAPTPDFGNKAVQIEEADAAALVRELESSTSLTAFDMRTWALPMIEELKKPVAPKPRKK